MRTKLTVSLILLVIGFLGGFIPQYLKARETSEQLSTQSRELSTCRLSQHLSNLRAAMAAGRASCRCGCGRVDSSGESRGGQKRLERALGRGHRLTCGSRPDHGRSG